MSGSEWVRWNQVGGWGGGGGGGGVGGGGGYILVHVGSNDADKVGTTELPESYRPFVKGAEGQESREDCAVGNLASGRTDYRNSRRMAINSQLQRMCEKE